MTTVETCKNNEEADNIFIIDVDNDSFSNINTSIPKSRARKPRGSKGLKSDMSFPMKAYIYIDDDDDVESPVNHSSVIPMSLSKNKRMYPGRGPTSHGLNIQLDDDEDDDDNNNKSAPIEQAIVNEREKIKDTVEYKQAQEEELTARQLALKLQAEEAQKLRRLLKGKKS